MKGSDPTAGDAYHVPVLCKAVLEGLITERSGIYVDGTVGGGGHAEAILGELESDAMLFGIDQDPDAVAECRKRFEGDPRFELLEGNSGHLKQLLASAGVTSVNGILLDLGVSSHQIQTAERGFSYRQEGPLDMRMDKSSDFTAGDFINGAGEREIVDVLRRYGEEPRAARIASAIVKARPFDSTRPLADAVAGVTPTRDVVKTLSRVFQAIRIHVNDELGALERALTDSIDLLVPGGRIVVISYHSLEDRRTKRFFRSGNFDGIQTRDIFGNVVSPLRPVSRRPVVADPEEVRANPRSRSARLRIAERIEAAQQKPR